MPGIFEDPIEKKVFEVEYKKMKEEGAPFHPFTTYKDIIAALALLLILIACTYGFGVHLDAPADPTSQYLPRPEWYFMWLFEMLKYFPGWTAIFPVAIIPGAIGAALILLPFYDMNPYRVWTKRPVAVISMSLGIFMIGFLTFYAYWQDAHDPHAQQLLKGAAAAGGHAAPVPAAAGGAFDAPAFFSAKCVMCHGAEGKNIPKVDLMSKASLATRDVAAILKNGTPMGMPSFKDQMSDDEMKAMAKWLTDNAK